MKLSDKIFILLAPILLVVTYHNLDFLAQANTGIQKVFNGLFPNREDANITFAIDGEAVAAISQSSGRFHPFKSVKYSSFDYKAGTVDELEVTRDVFANGQVLSDSPQEIFFTPVNQFFDTRQYFQVNCFMTCSQFNSECFRVLHDDKLMSCYEDLSNIKDLMLGNDDFATKIANYANSEKLQGCYCMML